MSAESPWIAVWQWVLTIGFGTFFLVVAVVIPLGALDVRRMFRRLGDRSRT